MAVWRTFRPVSRGNAGADSQGALFDQEGVRTRNVTIGAGQVVDPDVAWDGSAYVVAWSQYVGDRNREYDAVRFSRITPEGELKEPVASVSGS
jgi:hypothetical protein